MQKLNQRDLDAIQTLNNWILAIDLRGDESKAAQLYRTELQRCIKAIENGQGAEKVMSSI